MTNEELQWRRDEDQRLNGHFPWPFVRRVAFSRWRRSVLWMAQRRPLRRWHERFLDALYPDDCVVTLRGMTPTTPPPYASARMSVMVCVNNPDNGSYAGRLAGIHIDDFIRLEPRVFPEPRCTLRGDTFSVHRRAVKIYSHQIWVGNWCWDAITVDVTDLAGLLAHMIAQTWNEHRLWGIDCAEGEAAIELMDRLDKGATPTAYDWFRAMAPTAGGGD